MGGGPVGVDNPIRRGRFGREREREEEREMRGRVHVWRSSGAVCVYDDVLVYGCVCK